MSRVCLKCRNEVPDNAKFCRRCGSKLEAAKQISELFQCADCGKELSKGAKFCPKCGSKVNKGQIQDPILLTENPTSITVEKPAVCSACGGLLNENVQFCKTCGKRISEILSTTEQTHVKFPQFNHPVPAFDGTLWSAPDSPGESVFSGNAMGSDVGSIPAVQAIAATMGPLRILLSGGVNLVKSFFSALKSPKKLMPGLLIGLVWFIISILPALGITFPKHELASLLTFAGGGMNGGVAGSVGGILGKGVFAAVLVGLFTGRSHKASKSLVKTKEPEQRGSFGLLLTGAGIAMILFNFFTWDNSVQNSMIGVIAALGTIRAMGKDNGFLRTLVTALAQRFSPKLRASSKDIGILGAGLTTGFALAVPMTLISGPWMGYVLGLVLFFPGVLISKGRKSHEAVKSV